MKQITAEVEKLQGAASSAEDLQKLQNQMKETEVQREQQLKKLHAESESRVAEANKKKAGIIRTARMKGLK